MAALLVFAADFPLVQLIGLLITTITALGAMVHLRPYRYKSEFFSHIVGEVVSLFAVVVSCCLNYAESMSSESRNALGASIVYMMAVGTAVMSLGLLYETAKELIIIIKGFAEYSHIAPDN
eukprot:TRINITY_DN2825_c0_g2_i1.p1 TRINITY_DN2825_c0_g2~~TRINITY_DN2825_c0_g2_i1.p1  ORF type:complete len:132 (+),score=12.30 TRINITY_DN2825_c0_g2_i1:34-396(+)